jgi:L-serine/L-threonine ammonia-lyase
MVTLETIGSDCFYHSMSLNSGRFNSEQKSLPPNVELVHNEEYNVDMAHFLKFSSKASGSLGASLPAEGVLSKALNWKGGVKSISLPDELSMEAAVLFSGESGVALLKVVLDRRNCGQTTRRCLLSFPVQPR